MFVSCVHPVAVLNAAFCMTCSLLMLLKVARGDHMEEAYSRAGLMTTVWDRGYVSQHPCVWYYVGVKSSFQHARESKRAYVF